MITLEFSVGSRTALEKYIQKKLRIQAQGAIKDVTEWEDIRSDGIEALGYILRENPVLGYHDQAQAQAISDKQKGRV
jgi:hypothetical protein